MNLENDQSQATYPVCGGILVDATRQAIEPVSLLLAEKDIQSSIILLTGFKEPVFIAYGLQFDRVYSDRNDHLTGLPGFSYGRLVLFGYCVIIGWDDHAKQPIDARSTIEETKAFVRFLSAEENHLARTRREQGKYGFY